MERQNFIRWQRKTQVDKQRRGLTIWTQQTNRFQLLDLFSPSRLYSASRYVMIDGGLEEVNGLTSLRTA